MPTELTQRNDFVYGLSSWNRHSVLALPRKCNDWTNKCLSRDSVLCEPSPIILVDIVSAMMRKFLLNLLQLDVSSDCRSLIQSVGYITPTDTESKAQLIRNVMRWDLSKNKNNVLKRNSKKLQTDRVN